MADVAVTVMMDGKQVYAHVAGGAPDGFAFAAASLQSAADHFKNMVAATNKPIGFSANKHNASVSPATAKELEAIRALLV